MAFNDIEIYSTRFYLIHMFVQVHVNMTNKLMARFSDVHMDGVLPGHRV